MNAITPRLDRDPRSLRRESTATDAGHVSENGDQLLSVRDYVILVIQVALLALIVWQWDIESRHHLPQAMLIVLGGFSIHALLPCGWRQFVFCALSIACLVYVIGPVQAVCALLTGSALIAIVLARLPFWIKVGAMALAVAGLIHLRSGSDELVWPIVGSMFMFRLLVFLYSTRHEDVPRRFLPSLPYFFMLPNVFFPLYPVVDHKTFHRSYYNDDRLRIYQTGIHWIAVGVGQLILYRIIQHELLPTPVEIRTGSQLLLFFALNYALYVRVSGQFHLICGMLHLFGFNLPRTHNCYFLASSFSDIWRRINIYWKDFMKKIFFFPAFFALRKMGRTAAVMLALLWVFFWTWIAHSWQVFWLLGEFPFQASDALLWLVAGLAVAVSSALELRRDSIASEPQLGFQATRAAIHALKVIGVFLCVSVFWAKWSLRPDLFQALLFSGPFVTVSSQDVLLVLGTILLLTTVGVCVQYANAIARTSRNQSEPLDDGDVVARRTFDRSALSHLGLLILLVTLSQSEVYSHAGGHLVQLMDRIKSSRGHAVNSSEFIDGYYEQLNDGAFQASAFQGSPADPDVSRGGRYAAMTRPRRDLMEMELIPGWKGEFMGAQTTVNRWGMRDKDRRIGKAPGTFRIALVGSSPVMGYGVSDEQTFARLLEQKLNEADRFSTTKFEVLNFGAGRYYAIHRRVQIERVVLSFDPDLILYFAHQDELFHVSRWPALAKIEGVSFDDRCLESILEKSGIASDDTEFNVHRKMDAVSADILTCTYERIIDAVRRANVRIVFVYLPIPGDFPLPGDPKVVIDLAGRSGFETLDLDGWWGGAPVNAIINENDPLHPNAIGHQLIAERIGRELQQHSKFLRPQQADP